MDKLGMIYKIIKFNMWMSGDMTQCEQVIPVKFELDREKLIGQ